jgi:PIN domain nuclease of toxin-antitoxin system
VTLLLDTNILLRLLSEPEVLPPKILKELENPATPLFFSAISLWEIVIKSALGKLEADAAAVRSDLLAEGLNELSFTPDNAIEVATLARIHDDPFDRALIAQARAHKLVLLTTDRILSKYPVAVRAIKLRQPHG